MRIASTDTLHAAATEEETINRLTNIRLPGYVSWLGHPIFRYKVPSVFVPHP
jgi:hypothetical protein